jgi:hypothetical protein
MMMDKGSVYFDLVRSDMVEQVEPGRVGAS